MTIVLPAAIWFSAADTRQSDALSVTPQWQYAVILSLTLVVLEGVASRRFGFFVGNSY
jgi:hypothetical protein